MEIQPKDLFNEEIPQMDVDPFGQWVVQKKGNMNETLKILIFNDFLVEVNMDGSPLDAINFDFDLKFGFQYEPPSITLQRGNEHCTYLLEFQSHLIEWRNILKKKINQRGFHQQFKPLDSIGKGNFAVVYLVRKLQDKKLYAVKAFSKQSAYCEENGKECLIKQIQIMRNLNHPNLMKLEQVFQTQNSLYIVFQFLSGGQLYEFVKRKHKFKQFEVQKIIYGILKGLKQMHAKNIMHRDLKPENLLFREQNDFDCVIADFGLSEFSDTENYLYVRCGTPGYVAPEIISIRTLKAKYSPICDIYSLGLILYLLLFQKSPFPGKNQDEVLKQNKEAKIDFSSYQNEISSEALDLLKKMLQKNPFARITASQALEHPFFYDVKQDSKSTVLEQSRISSLHSTQNKKNDPNSLDCPDSPLLTTANQERKKNRDLRKDSCIEFKMGKQNIITGNKKLIGNLSKEQSKISFNTNIQSCTKKPKISQFKASRHL